MNKNQISNISKYVKLLISINMLSVKNVNNIEELIYKFINKKIQIK